MDILNRITALRTARGWSEYRLAKEAQLPQSTLANMYKRGNAPTIPTIEALCHAFDISLAQFFTEEGLSSDLTKEQEDLLDSWVLLSKSQKEKVMIYIQGLLQK